MKIQNEILIDEKNQMLIRDLVRTINQLPLPKGRGLQFQEKEHWQQESRLRFGY